MKRLIQCLLLIVPILINSCAEKKTEAYALTINKHNISAAEIDRTVEFIRQNMLQMAPETALEAVTPGMRKNAARQLIANDLMIDVANEKGMTIDSSIVANVFDQFKAQFGTQETFETEIAKMGETEAGIKKQMHDGALIDTLLKSMFVAIPPADSAAIRDYYEQNKDKYVQDPQIRVSQIFFPFDSSSSTDAGKESLLKEATSVLAKVQAGEDFSKLANKYSKEPVASSGGDLGWFGENDLRPDLAIPLSKLKKGENSAIVTSDIGFHILKKTETNDSKAAGFDEVKDHVTMVLTMQNQNDILNTFIDSLIINANVVYHDTSLAPPPRSASLVK